MSIWHAVFWGILGVIVVDGTELTRMICRSGGAMPPEWCRGGTWLAQFLRLAIAAIVVILFCLDGQISKPMTAFIVGASAPLFVEKLRTLDARGSNKTRTHSESDGDRDV